jgi:mono/diheme cytochrome c family protein
VSIKEDVDICHYFARAIYILGTATALLAFGPRIAESANLDDPALIAEGRRLFFNETFGGNGRTCGTCHREERNFVIDPAFIATLPPNDPLFVAEFVPALRENFEKPALMRQFGLILENLNGFGDLANNFTMRSVQHNFALRTSVASVNGPRTGWSGDGSPGDGSLRSFANGAVTQHFTKTLNRTPGVDFRLPTDAELDALEAFQLSLGRQQNLILPLPLKGAVALQGQTIFMDSTLGKCNGCHANAGAGPAGNNRNNGTGIEDLPNLAYKQVPGIVVPRDDGFGNPGDNTFNVPPLIEAADTPPFFHNNAFTTIEQAVGFYSSETFANSISGRNIAANDPNGIAIRLDAGQTQAVAAFLRVLNTIENLRQSDGHLQLGLAALTGNPHDAEVHVVRALNEIGDGINVLSAVSLHPEAAAFLRTARDCANRAVNRSSGGACPGPNNRRNLVQQAILHVQLARGQLTD